MQRRFAITMSIFASVVAAGCTDPNGTAPRPVAKTPRANSARDERPAFLSGSDARFYDLARRIPGFAGVTIDQPRAMITVMTTRAGLEAALSNAISAEFQPQPDRPNLFAGRLPTIAFQRVEFDFAELADWRARIETEIHDPAINFYALIISKNRIEVGVDDGDAVRRVTARLSDMGIPNRAVHVAVHHFVETKELGEHFDSAFGGLRIRDYDATAVCTLGVNAYNSSGQRVFVTASHCTSQHYAPDITPITFYQPAVSTYPVPIGSEIADANVRDCIKNGVAAHCRLSDAALIGYDNSYSWKFGEIAVTTTTNGTGVVYAYSDSVIEQVTGDNIYTGEPISRVGATSGTEQSNVQATNVDKIVAKGINGGPDLWITGSILTYGTAMGGDSGGPVYIKVVNPDFPNRMDLHMTGIVFAQDTEPSELGWLFSKLGNVQAELGSLTISPVRVTLSGTTVICRAPSTGSWTAIATGSVQPSTPRYHYRWEEKIGFGSWGPVGADQPQYTEFYYSIKPNTNIVNKLRVTVSGASGPGQTTLSSEFTFYVRSVC